jgi:hypothetical protein
MAAPLIFQIGFNRCGTEALYRFFSGSGIPSVHWSRGNLAKVIHLNISAGRSPLAGFDGFRAFFDMEGFIVIPSMGYLIEAFKYFSALYRAYPDAVFILNTRSRDRWLESRLAHAGGDYARLYQELARIPSRDALIRHWLDDWDRHHDQVRSFFADRGRLVEFNIESDDASKLVAAIPELDLDARHFQRIPNVTSRIIVMSGKLEP